MEPDRPHLVVRADASGRIGAGHVMRSLTLANELAVSGWQVSLVSHELPAALRDRAARYGVGVCDLTTPPSGATDAEMLLALRPSFAVVDGYTFGDEFFDTLARGGLPHLIIDDNCEVPLGTASVVLNQNLHAHASLYAGLPDHVRLLLGPTYTLIRPEVRAIGRGRHASDAVHRVFISVGGADVLGLMPDLIEAIDRLPDVEVVTTSATERMALPEISNLLASAEIAVISAGTTMWEACYLGVPSVVLIVADNQAESARAALQLGVVRRVDCRATLPYDEVADQVRSLLSNADERRAVAMAGRRLIDGNGAHRVASVINELAGGGEIR